MIYIHQFRAVLSGNFTQALRVIITTILLWHINTLARSVAIVFRFWCCGEFSLIDRWNNVHNYIGCAAAFRFDEATDHKRRLKVVEANTLQTRFIFYSHSFYWEYICCSMSKEQTLCAWYEHKTEELRQNLKKYANFMHEKCALEKILPFAVNVSPLKGPAEIKRHKMNWRMQEKDGECEQKM